MYGASDSKQEDKRFCTETQRRETATLVKRQEMDCRGPDIDIPDIKKSLTGKKIIMALSAKTIDQGVLPSSGQPAL